MNFQSLTKVSVKSCENLVILLPNSTQPFIAAPNNVSIKQNQEQNLLGFNDEPNYQYKSKIKPN